MGNPESLHDKAKETGKKSVDNFVNKGTPSTALYTEADIERRVATNETNQRLRNKVTSK